MTNEFSDKNGRKWKIDLSIGDVLRVKKASGGKFNLLDLQHPLDVAGPVIPGLAAEVQNQQHFVLRSDWHLEEFYELLWYLIQPQAESQEIHTAEEFGKAIAGDCLLAAREVFFQEWEDFFRQLQQTEKVLLLDKTSSYMRMFRDSVNKQMSSIDLTNFETRLRKKLDPTLNNISSDLQASLESTLSDTPGEPSTD